MARHVARGPRAGAARRLEVYASGYRSRLVEALGNDYPALRATLGARAFERLLAAFVDGHPSTFANLRWYGGALAGFLRRSPLRRGGALLAELAEFEWALGLAFDAADLPLLGAQEIARVQPRDWPGMRVGLHPSVQRLSLRTAAPQVWRAAIRGGRKPRTRPRPAEWLVWRRALEPFYRALAADEAWALDAIGRGRDFAFVCAGLARWHGAQSAAQRGAQLLKTWLAEGLLCAAPAVR